MKIKHNDINDPILKQILPHLDELNYNANFISDPVNDQSFKTSSCIIHKYKSRALLILTGQCAVHCRYCFRRHFPYDESQFHQNDIPIIVDYFKTNTQINEVIFSGGDPFSLHHKTLNKIITALEDIEHLSTIRFHSRVPVVDPNSIIFDYIKSISSNRFNKVLVVHTNHPNEIEQSFKTLMTHFKSHGFTLLNQSVLLKDINDAYEVLKELSLKLFESGVLPYYINQLDRVTGATHFEVPKEIGLKIIAQLQSELPGYLVPKYVQDIGNDQNKVHLS